MRTLKKYRYFSIVDYEKEQEFLSEMHRNGWRFVKVTGVGFYHFEECEPAEVVYQLDYNQEGIEHKSEYIKMFSDCGWDYIQDYMGYSYFSKPKSEMNGDEGIFCDESSRIAMMERVFKGRMLPLVVIFSACLIPQFFLNLFSFHNHGVAAFLGGIIGLYLVVFATFGIKYIKYRRDSEK